MHSQRLAPHWHASILLLALCLPCEFHAFWLSLGGVVGFTDLELLAVLVLGLCFGVLFVQRRRTTWPALTAWPVGVAGRHAACQRACAE